MVDVTTFFKHNVIDSCAISNLVSSTLFLNAALGARCEFCCTYFVEYEALHKKFAFPTPEKEELRRRFRTYQADGNFKTFHLYIDDLQDVDVLHNRKRLSMGELSSIAFARKTGQGFLTDDKKARALAETELDARLVQTTPKLLGWLLVERHLNDTDKSVIIQEHVRLGRPLARPFEDVYWEAAQRRLAASQESASG